MSLPPTTTSKQSKESLRSRIVLIFAVLLFLALISLRLLGLIRPFSVPTAAMTPAVSHGDHIMMEGITYLARKPQCGDILVFKTDGIPLIKADSIYIKRLVGEPGQRLRLSDGKLFVNDAQVVIKNNSGEIRYVSGGYLRSSSDTVVVPADSYFVLGDNSTNSADSRYFGFIPAKNVIGRASICYWPPQRMGRIK